MPVIARRILPLIFTIGLTACAVNAPGRLPANAIGLHETQPPPQGTVRPAAAHGTKSAVLVRPRMLGRALTAETLAPSATVQPLDTALYDDGQTPALRSAGLRQLSAQHLSEGRADAALGAARAGHELALEAYGPDHVETIAALIDLADALTAAGRATEGETVLLLAARDATKLFGPGHPATRAAAGRLALHRGLAPLGPLLRSFNRRANRVS
ncbi:MAG TPA: hypothetical protein VGR32_05800 [Brevundimonas sp.]|jgi:hypothetical protein|uniref:hypothetical protein n=1 Tax=Brevundimonas sp. TaxID=1871086 RepID=UPI002DE47E12|nr:hypothetical protein [Brevundimonas sp.]